MHRGRRRRWITPSEICRILHILPQPNSIIALLFIQNNSNFKNKLKMLTSVDVKFTSIVHLFREIQQIKVCSGLQIYSKQQMLSVELTSRCSCYVFRQHFAVKEYSVSRRFRHFHVQTNKTTQPRPQVSSVNGSISQIIDVMGSI